MVMHDQIVAEISKGNSIPAWRWSRTMISLRDVQTYLAKRLVSVSESLQRCHFVGIEANEITAKERADLNRHLRVIVSESRAISLPMTALLAERLVNEITYENFHDKIGELESRFEDEIVSIRFFLPEPNAIPFYENTELAGADFKARFPSGNTELIEAGNCFVLARYTACVFHVMRSLEVALRSLERSLGIPEDPRGPQNTWGNILRRIQEKIAHNNASPPADWTPARREFCEKALALLQSVKAPYRDTTMHVKASYDEQSAKSLLVVIPEVLRFLATELRE